jgi:hypothetical protein
MARTHLPRPFFPLLLALGLGACAQVPAPQVSEKAVATPGVSVVMPAASIVTATAYVARAEAPILTGPADGKQVIATLRRGQRVLSGGNAATGWVAIDLDDGSLGYVALSALRQVQPNASEKLIASATAE